MIEIDNLSIDVNNEETNSKQALKTVQIYNYEISYNTFLKNNLERNEPCIFDTWITEKWAAIQDWVTPNGSIHYEFLSESFGSAKVPVANCSKKYFDSQKKEIFTLEEFINYMKSDRQDCLYLKDWHFVKEIPYYSAYITPPFFSSDWLNEFWSVRCDSSDDYSFVYIGPKGTWTPFHADVFRSYSWSSNICGRKRWVLYPPQDELNLRDKFGNIVYDIEDPELQDKSKYPLAGDAKGRLEVIQEKGQTIFVPSKWFHQVWNLEDTISINHNWINGTNILIVWDFLLSSLKEVERSIKDCSSMEGWANQVQLILKSIHGMDLVEYFHFLKTISLRRLKYLNGDSTVSSFPQWQLGPRHVNYDIKKLIRSLELLLDEIDSSHSECFDENDHPSHILTLLQEAL